MIAPAEFEFVIGNFTCDGGSCVRRGGVEGITATAAASGVEAFVGVGEGASGTVVFVVVVFSGHYDICDFFVGGEGGV